MKLNWVHTFKTVFAPMHSCCFFPFSTAADTLEDARFKHNEFAKIGIRSYIGAPLVRCCTACCTACCLQLVCALASWFG